MTGRGRLEWWVSHWFSIDKPFERLEPDAPISEMVLRLVVDFYSGAHPKDTHPTRPPKGRSGCPVPTDPVPTEWVSRPHVVSRSTEIVEHDRSRQAGVVGVPLVLYARRPDCGAGDRCGRGV